MRVTKYILQKYLMNTSNILHFLIAGKTLTLSEHKTNYGYYLDLMITLFKCSVH